MSRTAWSLVEAALVIADRPLTAELPETAARPVEVQLVYLPAILPRVRLRPLASLQPVAFLLPGVKELSVLALAALELPQVAELCRALLAARNCHRELSGAGEVSGQVPAHQNFRLHLLKAASVPPGEQGVVLPDLFQLPRCASQQPRWELHRQAGQRQRVLEPRQRMPARKNPCPGAVRHLFPETTRMDPELSQRKTLVPCLCLESPPVSWASA